MRYVLDFSLDLWIRKLEIVADSEDDAKQQLAQMTLDEILEEGSVADFDISNVDIE